MRKFNRSIEVSFSVDAIANMIKEQLKDTFLHADLLVEALIAPMVVNQNNTDKGRLGLIIGALFGKPNVINIAVGAVVNCTDTFYCYIKDTQTNIGKATVLEVEAFKDHGEVRVEFEKTDRKGVIQKDTKWVSVGTLEDWIEPAHAPRCEVTPDAQEVIVNF